MPAGNPGVSGDFMSITTAPVNLYSDIATGNDANPGTQASPKQTILGALAALPVGIAHPCTIHVRPGNYPENNIALDFDRFNTLDYITIKAVNAADEDMFYAGLATGGGNNFLDDAGAAWSANQFQNAYIWIFEGLGAGQIRQIASNTATRITTTVNWAVNPNATSYYVIGGGATLTGTDLYHLNIIGKSVNVYGFRHTGATTYDIFTSNFANNTFKCNYFATSVTGILGYNFVAGNWVYNYSAATTTGLQIQGWSCVFPRANVLSGATNGVMVTHGSLAQMHTVAGTKNYFLNCTTGIRIVPTGSGCMAASVQVFSGCITNINPGVSTVVPQWWT